MVSSNCLIKKESEKTTPRAGCFVVVFVVVIVDNGISFSFSLSCLSLSHTHTLFIILFFRIIIITILFRCENCKSMAPTLYQVEESYRDQVNFVMVNGDDPNNWPLIEKLGVDAIPHLALIEADGTVDTALIGPVPKEWLTRDLDVLIENAKSSVAGDWSDGCITTAAGGGETVITSAAAADAAPQDASASSTVLSSTTQLCAAATTTTDTDVKKPLPYQMLDVFANRPIQERRIAGSSLFTAEDRR
jgi:thiol-disulfide isomerase/thioredoxin